MSGGAFWKLATVDVSALARLVLKNVKLKGPFPGLPMNPSGYINGVYEFTNEKRDDD